MVIRLEKKLLENTYIWLVFFYLALLALKAKITKLRDRQNTVQIQFHNKQ